MIEGEKIEGWASVLGVNKNEENDFEIMTAGDVLSMLRENFWIKEILLNENGSAETWILPFLRLVERKDGEGDCCGDEE